MASQTPGLGPDEGLEITDFNEVAATELERSAGLAGVRSGAAAAAELLQRAAERTPDATRRGRRALNAAGARLESGGLDGARELLAMASTCPLGDADRAELAHLRARFEFAIRRGVDAPPQLLRAAEMFESCDPDRAREGYLDALGATIYAGRLHYGAGPVEVAAAARRGAPPGTTSRPTDLLLNALVCRLTDGYIDSVELLQQALTQFTAQGAVDPDDFVRWFWLPWLIAADLWDEESWRLIADRAVDLVRATDATVALPLALGYRAFVLLHRGEFAAAAELATEAEATAAATGSAPVRYPSLVLAAWRGDDPDGLQARFCRELADLTARGEARGIGGAAYATALLHNGLGRHEAALAAARVACEYDDLGMLGLSLLELVEAAVRTGARDEAASAMRQLQERTNVAATDWALGVGAWADALLAEDEDAEPLYLEAIRRLSRCQAVVHLGRAHLAYGEWLVRNNHRRDARIQLTRAECIFREVGAQAFAERARRELVGARAALRLVPDEAPSPTTCQEVEIAQVAGDDLTAVQAGSALYLSRHTVEWYMKKSFARLGIVLGGDGAGSENPDVS
ncbi:hypothetical protein [Nocardioides sp. YIM 152315]|uniref:hypothetical protein n=1 Tax=Nocardioides sp. YIM 152315 TaxID=3031760 RepID=UPI0023DC1B6C|nr:hypothetical protein [Nocardioides sp. YIM 152315]MDF1602045.1 hypothetical protein [Nocardioides sp. YIM 152315]